ncbi:MAG: YceI family protein [Cyclobacteriaceae bacterium]|nr:YceI family protein [Cyclobacteriaceae bacterium]
MRDFFDVARYPTSSFVIRKVAPRGGDCYTITGDITIKGVSKTLDFMARIENNGEVLEAFAEIKIDRSELDVQYGSGSIFDDLGDQVIYDEFTLNVHLVARKTAFGS